MEMTDKSIALEQTFVDTLEALPGMAGRVCPVAEVQLSCGPLMVFLQHGDDEARHLAGRSGLYSAEYELHVMHGTYKAMRSLAERAKEAVYQLQGLHKENIRIEDVSLELAAPDLLENRVGLYRRSYRITFLYQ